MMNFHLVKSAKAAACCCLAATLVSCNDFSERPTGPVVPQVSQVLAGGGALPSFPEMVPVIPAVRIRPGADSRRELTDAELIDLVRRADGKVIIGLKPSVAARTRDTGIVPEIERSTALAARAVIEGRGAVITQSFRYSSAVAATIEPELAPELRMLPVVDYIEVSHPGSLSAAPQDTTPGLLLIGAHHVWDHLGNQANRCEDSFITILDGGIDEIHRTSPTGDGPAGLSSWDCYFVTGTGTTCYGNGHGAHVAGIIAARNNTFGYIGVAHEPAGFASIKVCDVSEPQICRPEWVVPGIEWVIDYPHSRRIINMSLGFCEDHTLLAQAVVTAAKAGVLLVASAGNHYYGQVKCDLTRDNDLPNAETDVMFPARYPSVMAVSGTTLDDEFVVAPLPGSGGGGGGDDSIDTCWGDVCEVHSGCGAGSRFGPEVEIAAPFVAWSLDVNGTYKHRCGTSMSAAFVTGVAALIWSRAPNWPANHVRLRLRATAVPYSPAAHFGSGRVNALAAVHDPGTNAAWLYGANEVQEYVQCTWLALTNSQNSPFTYQWYVHNLPTGPETMVGSDYYLHHSATEPFRLMVRVQDSAGQVMFGLEDIDVRWDAPECIQQ